MDGSLYEKGYPPNNPTGRLAVLVGAVCPSHGVQIGRWNDRETWALDHFPEATQEEIDAAHAIMAAFDPWADEPTSAPQPLESIREAYEDSHADDESPDEMGLGEPALDDPGCDVGEEEIIAPPDDPDPSDAFDEPDPANSGGVLIRELGDALSTAKAIALMAVDDERFNWVGDYDKAANQSRLDELRAIQQAIREGVHPQFTDEQTEELQALETFLPFMQRIDDHAQGLRNAIREAGDLEVLTSIDIISGWPE